MILPFHRNTTIHIRVICPLVSHRYVIGKMLSSRLYSFFFHDFIHFFYRIFIQLTDNADRHKISDKFDFGLL